MNPALDEVAYTPLSDEQWDDIEAGLEQVIRPTPMRHIFNMLMNRGYRNLSLSQQYPQYIRAVPVASGGGVIDEVGDDFLMYQIPGRARIAIPFGIILLEMR